MNCLKKYSFNKFINKWKTTHLGNKKHIECLENFSFFHRIYFDYVYRDIVKDYQ